MRNYIKYWPILYAIQSGISTRSLWRFFKKEGYATKKMIIDLELFDSVLN